MVVHRHIDDDSVDLALEAMVGVSAARRAAPSNDPEPARRSWRRPRRGARRSSALLGPGRVGVAPANIDEEAYLLPEPFAARGQHRGGQGSRGRRPPRSEIVVAADTLVVARRRHPRQARRRRRGADDACAACARERIWC